MSGQTRPAERSEDLTNWVVADALVAPIAEAPADAPFDSLLQAFERHIAAEEDTLVAYRTLAESTSDPVIALLMRQVLEDEDRHHGLLRSMAARLRDTLHWTHSPEALPTRGAPSATEAKAMVEGLHELVRHEQESARAAREMARQQGGLYDGLFELLLETMALDSEKHERVLGFVARRMQQRLAGA